MHDRDLRLKKCISKLNDLSDRKHIRLAPLLVTTYQNACFAICGIHPGVKASAYQKFEMRMHELDELGISYDSYAHGVIVAWHDWCVSKGMHVVPAHIFTGKRAFDRFMNVVYATIDTPHETDLAALMYDEQVVAEYYLTHDCSWNDAVDATEERTSQDLCNGLHDVLPEVLDYYNMLYGTSTRSLRQLRKDVRGSLPWHS